MTSSKLDELECQIGQAVEKLWADVRHLESENFSLREERDLLEAKLRATEDACVSLKEAMAQGGIGAPVPPLKHESVQTEFSSSQDVEGLCAELDRIRRWKSEAVDLLELQRDTVKALQLKYRRLLLFADELQRKLRADGNST